MHAGRWVSGGMDVHCYDSDGVFDDGWAKDFGCAYCRAAHRSPIQKVCGQHLVAHVEVDGAYLLLSKYSHLEAQKSEDVFGRSDDDRLMETGREFTSYWRAASAMK